LISSFSTVGIAFSSLLFLITLSLPSSSIFFLFGADPGMPSSPSPSQPASSSSQSPTTPPLGGNTRETPSIPPFTPISPSVDAAIKKILDGLPKSPLVEEKIDPKDGHTILSSKIKEDIDVATKVAKDSVKKTFDENRGYVKGLIFVFDPKITDPKKIQSAIESLIVIVSDPDKFSDPPDLKSRYNIHYFKGLLKGIEDGLILDKNLELIKQKNTNKK
jgi:hypothetical protein